MKVCSKCSIAKQPDEMVKTGACCLVCRAAYKKEYYLANKDKIKSKVRKYYEMNTEKCQRVNKEWAERNLEKMQQYKRKYYAANKEICILRAIEFNKSNQELSKQYIRTWKIGNKARLTAYSAKRRGVKKKAVPVWANLAAVERMYIEAKKWNMHVDHIVPLVHPVVCGLHCEANLQLLVPEENFKKNNKFWPDMP